ncbi:unnamed protein product, partial [marine sediment metagenome]
VWKILEFELFLTACILGAPTCAFVCAKVCALSGGLLCTSCYVRCAAETVEFCTDAYDHWIEASDAGCVP